MRAINTRLNASEMSANEQIGAKPICLTGKDELSWLAQKTQEMVSKLQSKGEELRLNHDRLQETVAKLASVNSVLEHAVEGIARLDSRDRIAATNGSFASNFGFRRGDMCERPWQSIIQPENHDVFAEAIKTAKSCGKSSIELIACRADKSLFHAEFVFIKSNRTGSDSEGLHIFMKDISERKSLETRIEHQAFHDSLTGLPNRAKFMDRLAHALTRAKRHGVGVSVLFLDLDNFKIINDSLGHEAGDQLLISIAERLKECLREEDTIARLGGDEFTVILEDINSVERAVEVANRIVTSLALPIQLEHCETVAMASIGISFCVGGSEPAEVLLREADTAMYVAKDRGKSGFALFDQSMNQEVVERMEIEMGLRQALERGDFVLEYQPIVSLMSGDVTGVEALIRWDHPERGRIPPDKFIAVAEECGMIVPIGAWVLQKACTDMLAPQFDGLLLSVNISGRQLQRPNFIEMVSETLVDSGFDPGRLQLEVTESVLIGDLSESIDKLHELKDLGVQIAIDDFGTGYSSLSTLNSYPVDVVKIDRSFICRMGEEDEVDAIVGAIVLLCKVLKLEVTAEGLETRQQVQYLQAFGCDTAQGYYFSRPLPLNQFAELMPNGLNLSIALEFRNQEIHNPMQAA